MSDSAVTVRSVDWRGVLPAIFLVRGMRIAFRPSLIVVGALGIALSCIGWWIGDRLFLNSGSNLRPVAHRLESPLPSMEIGGVEIEVAGLSLGGVSQGGVVENFANRFYVPAKTLFRPGISFKETAFLVFGLLWQLAVWSLAGALITRQALVELATEEDPGLTETLKFVRERFLFYLGAPLFPILGVLMLALPLMFLGLLMRTDVGVFLAGLIWIVVAIIGLLASWLLVGLALGWPLLWGSVSAEPDGDHFGAMSRMYSYVYQRPLNYLLYLLLVVVIGLFAGWLITAFAETAINVARWGVSWGMNADRSADILREIAPGTGRNSGAFGYGVIMIRCIEHAVRALAAGLGASYFWCSFAGIYLLLRKDVDDKELDDVLIPRDDIRPGPVEVSHPSVPAKPPAAPMRFEPGQKVETQDIPPTTTDEGSTPPS